MGRTFTSTDNGNAGSGTAVDALGGSAFTQIHLIRRLTTDGTNQVIATKPFAGATGWAFLLDNAPAAGCLRFRLCRATTNTDYISDTGSAIAQNTTRWVAAVYGSGSASRILTRGLAAGAFTEIGYSTSVAGSGAYNADNAANLIIGNNLATSGTTPFSGNIYVSAFFPGALTNAEIQEWADKQRPSMFSPTAWWYIGLADPEADQSGNGITLDITGTSVVGDVETPYVITSAQIADTETPSDQTNYLKYSAGARIEYTLGGAATEVDVAMHNTYDSATFGGDDAVGVWHKAAGRVVPRYLGSIYAGGSLGGAASNAYRGSLTGLTLASGDKITLLAGCRQKTGLTGTWPVTARFWDSTTPQTATVTTPTTPDLRVCFVGYSTLLEMASPQHERSWPIKYRLADGNEQRVFLDQKGGLSLFDEGVDASARTTYANRLAAFNARLYVMDHGDFVTNQQSAANYQTALQDLCEKLLSAAPTAKILLYQVHILQSSDETTPNSFGDVVEDYRDAIRNVVATIGNSRLTTIDHSKITPWTAAGDTTDGRHPNDGGHIKIYDYTVPTIQRLLNLAPGAERVRALDLPLPLRLKWYPRRDESRSGVIAAGGGSIESGDGSAAIAISSSGIGAATVAADGASAVVVSGAAVGASTAEAAGASALVVAVAGVGASTVAADGLGACTVACSGVGAANSGAAGSASIAITGSAVGTSTAAADGLSACTIAGAGVGSSVAASAGSSSTVIAGAAVGTGIVAAAGSSSVVLTGAGVGEAASGSDGAGSSSLVLTCSGIGTSTAASAGASATVITGSGVGAATSAVAGSSSVVCSASGVSEELLWGAGSSACQVTAAGVGSSVSAAAGASSIVLTGSGVSASTAEASAASAIVITCAAVSSGITPPDRPTVAVWVKNSDAPTVTAWVKGDPSGVIGMNEELPLAA